MRQATHDAPPTGWIVLPGHPDLPARVEVVRCSPLARAYRTVLFGFLSLAATAGAFVVTIFDPFISSIPLLVGGMATWRSWRGRFRVTRFEGACPRCRHPLALAEGSRIGSPHPLVCYECHHEPELFLPA
jgi:hypothetical protein